MDEAERCHEIAYIAYGVLLTHGTVEEVIAQFGPRHLHGERRGDLNKLPQELTGAGRRYGRAVRQQPARVRPRPGGARGGDRALPERSGDELERSEPSLEDVFIELMSRAKDNFQ